MAQVNSSLVGRRIKPITSKDSGYEHVRTDLPFGVSYIIHTVYIDPESKEAMAIAERAPHEQKGPESVSVMVVHLGLMWRLMKRSS